MRVVGEELETRWLLTSVMRVAPSPNTHGASLDSELPATFDQPIDATRLTADRFVVHGMQTGRLLDPPSAIQVDGGTISRTAIPRLKPGELVEVTLTNGIIPSNVAMDTIPFVWHFRVGASGGTARFTNTKRGIHVRATDHPVLMGDLDGDGDLDVIAPGRDGAPFPRSYSKVWLNDGTGRFLDSGYAVGEEGFGQWESVAIGDVDGDGDLDAIVPARAGHDVWLNT